MSPDLFKHLILLGKALGEVTGASGFVYGIFKWFGKVNETNKNVKLLATNHIPHIQSAIEAHSESLQGIKTDVRVVSAEVQGLSNRLDDTKKGVEVLATSFLQHIDGEKRIPGRRKKDAVRK